MQLRFLKGKWDFGNFKLQYKEKPNTPWTDVPTEGGYSDSDLSRMASQANVYNKAQELKEKSKEWDVLMKETRAVFKKWLGGLTDEDVDKIVGTPPSPVEKSLSERLAEKFEGVCEGGERNCKDEVRYYFIKSSHELADIAISFLEKEGWKK